MNLYLFLIGSLLLSFSFLIADPLELSLAGESVLLMNAESGLILFEKEAHMLRYPASTTKIATALYILKLKGEDLNDLIVAEQDCLTILTEEAKKKANYQIPPYRLEPDGTHISLKTGEQMALYDLMHGLMIASGNDAANVIAHFLGPTVPKFMEGMNAYLRSLGCQQTTLYNPHGLHYPQHQTTAYDLALMTKEALKNKLFRQIVSQVRFARPKTNKQAATTLLQGNRLLRPGKFYYSKAIGVKTGYHSKAKNNLVAAAESQGRLLIAVMMGYRERATMFEEAVKLFETAFNQPKVQRQFLAQGPQAFTQLFLEGQTPLKTYLSEPVVLSYYPAEDPKPKCLLYWHALSLPLLKDQQVGEIHLVSAHGDILQKVPLLALEEVPLKWFPHIKRLLSSSWLLWVSISVIVLTTWLLLKRLRRD